MTAGDERFVHRLEAFSDIVIGFSLAQLGATLVVPPHPQTLTENPGWLVAFSWTFALVCSMWWNHNRVFRTPFHPTAASLVANFVVLASIVLLVYFAQVFARAATAPDAIFAARWYFAMLGTTYVFTAWLYQTAHGWVRGTAVNGISGVFQVVVVAAMASAVPLGFVLGALAGRRFPTAVAAA